MLRALREMCARIEEISAAPDGDWHAELIQALEALEVLDAWLTHGGLLPTDWTHPA